MPPLVICIVMKKNNIPSPAINGTLEISHKNNGIFIGGTPEALKSLAKTLIWLAEFDQDIEDMPNGEREHIHLHIKIQKDYVLLPQV